MAYTPSYDALVARKRRPLTDAAVPERGLQTMGGDFPDPETVKAFASRRAGELEADYRQRDLDRDYADLNAWGALHRRQQKIIGEGNVQRYYAENPMREGQFQEERQELDYKHGQAMERTALQNEAKYLSPYLNFMGKMDANDATRERTKAQYGDPAMEGNPAQAKPGFWDQVGGALGSLFNRGAKKAPAADPNGAVAAPDVAGAADPGEPQTIEELVGALKRRNPQASPRDLVAILNEQVEFDDPAELEAATRLLLGLQR